MVFVQGGPGGDVVGLSQMFVEGEGLEPIKRDHDVYLVNPRGLGENGDPYCPELPGTWAERDNASELLAICLANEREELAAMSTATSVADLDQLRSLVSRHRRGSGHGGASSASAVRCPRVAVVGRGRQSNSGVLG